MEISVRELKNHLSEYLRRVQAGEEVIVTSHKRIVAKLVPPNQAGKVHEQDEVALIERLKSMPWIRWAGGKPELRPGIAVKKGDRTIAESLLDDRR
jgi:prevent-host-death family protein